MKTHVFVCVLTAAVVLSGCIGFEHTSTSTGPSASGVDALMGTWASASVVPSPSSCTDFKWNASEKTSTSAKGTFSATCPNDLKVTGTAEGTLTGSTVRWNASGNTTSPSQGACTFNLDGTAELAADSIRVPYSGDVCGIRVNGTEILNRK
jgi:hypothetical protein